MSEIIVQELIVKKGDKEIYGMLYCPVGEGKFPAIIISHGYNGAHSHWENECRYYAENGFLAYAYDFCGGSTVSKSSGCSTDMTIFTEKEDLLDVFDYISSLPEVDSRNVFLFGQSQGGLITTLAAEEIADRVKAVALYYPALNIPDDWRRNFVTEEEIPEVKILWNLALGRKFFLVMREFYTFENIGGFKGNVLFIHGDKDNIVPLEYSEKAVEIYENGRLVVMQGEGHGYAPEASKEAMKQVLQFMQGNL